MTRRFPMTTRRFPPRAAACALLALAATACDRADDAPSAAIDYEHYELDNGLDVILHVDRSDPVAAVAMTFHVGSAREIEGRTGFAHLFEHLFFLDSENLGPGGLDRLMTRIGSATNGSTSRDRTNYFEVVPVDGLEKALWAEADKLGFFINTVTESVVAKEKQVVKNEKRQSVDNRPYGHTNFVIDQALYPEGHPYRWQVIGSLQDLDAATLADAREFHARWYGPGNATLVVAGDIAKGQTRAWIHKYFGEIPARETPPAPEPPPVELAETRLLFHEDNFARLPRLTLAWPTVPLYHPDAYPLAALAALLADGKSTPLYKVLVEEEELAPDVSAFNFSQELAGRFTVQVGAFAGTDLDDVRAAVESAFARFEQEGVPEAELQRVKASTESAFHRGLSSVLGKAFQLARYAIFAEDAGFAEEDLRRTLAVTEADVMRVYQAYLADHPYVATSFVPRGEAGLAVEGSERAAVVEEPIVQGAEAEFTVARGEERTPQGAFDRSVEPPIGYSPGLSAPEVWIATVPTAGSPTEDDATDNTAPTSDAAPAAAAPAAQFRAYGIEDREVPVAEFELRFRGGMMLDEPSRIGIANLLAETMLEGTANRTPEDLEQAMALLGASINVSAGPRDLTLSGSVLARNYAETIALVEEILLEPRFDSARFALAKQRVENGIRRQAANPNAVAAWAFNRLVYGDHVLAENPSGTLESVAAVTLNDLRDYRARALVPGAAAFHVAGAVSQEEALEPLERLASRWAYAPAPEYPQPPAWSPERAGLYFIDVPGAAQSVLAVGRLALAQTDTVFYPATVMNFRLGGGGFASELTLELREGKGYTYGIGSGFQGSDVPGPFVVRSAVRSNVTLESLALIKDIVERHGPQFDEEDLEITKGFLLRANAGAFETLRAKLGILRAVSAYGFEPDYVLQREQIVRDMTVDRIRELASHHLDTNDMIWLVVGDAATQRARLRALGLGTAIALDRDGRQLP